MEFVEQWFKSIFAKADLVLCLMIDLRFPVGIHN